MKGISNDSAIIKGLVEEAKMSEAFSKTSFFIEKYSKSRELRNEMILISCEYSIIEREIKLRISTPDLQTKQINLLRKLLYIIEEVEAENYKNVLETKSNNSAKKESELVLLPVKPSKSCQYKSSKIIKKYPEFELGPTSLQLNTGEITTVVGENGSGKTTLLKIIAGIIKNEGEPPEYFDQKYNNWYEIKKNIGYVPQHIENNNLKPHLLMKLNASMHGIYGHENELMVNDVLIKLGLNEHLDKPWDQLSGGYRLRMELAQILVWRPKLLILDEPLAYLDYRAQHFLLRTLREYCDSAMHPLSIILTAQHISEVEGIADNLIFLDRGTEIYNGRISDIEVKYPFKIYELQTNVTIEDLINVLHSLDENISIVDSNISRVTIKCPKHLCEKNIFDFIYQNGACVNYFMDITNSSKRFFI